jgi:putative transposase
VIETIRQGLKDDGYTVSISQLCRWFGIPRRTVYYRPTRKPPRIQERFAVPIKKMIEEQHPSFGYRTVAHLLGFNKNTVQRIFQLMRWQVRTRPVGFRPRVRALPSVAMRPNERWATDLCRVWTGRDGWATLALVMDCHSRELLGWHLSRSGRSKTAESALEQALHRAIRHSWTSPDVLPAPFGQRPGVHLQELHRAGAQLRTTPGVHHATQS